MMDSKTTRATARTGVIINVRKDRHRRIRIAYNPAMMPENEQIQPLTRIEVIWMEAINVAILSPTRWTEAIMSAIVVALDCPNSGVVNCGGVTVAANAGGGIAGTASESEDWSMSSPKKVGIGVP